MTKRPRRLRFDLELGPDESIPGAVARATAGHHLDRLNVVLKEAGLPGKYAGATQLMSREGLRDLAGVMRCDAESLAERSGRRLVEAGPRRGRHYLAFGDLVLPRFLIDLRSRRIAPDTLASDPLHRADWLVTVLPYCPRSLERLVDRCPGCGRALGWVRTRGIARCESCEATVPPSEAPRLPDADADDYRIFAGLVSPTGTGRGEAYEALPEGLRGLPPGDLARLAIKWGLEAAGEEGSVVRAWQTRATKLPAERLAAIVVSGARMLLSWPESLRDWVTSAEDAVGAPTGPNLQRRVRRMGVGDGGYSARFDVVREALPSEMLRDAAAFADCRRTYSQNEVRRLLPQSIQYIREIRAKEALPFATTRERREPTYRYCAEAVDEVVARARDAVSVATAQRSLGLPVYAVEQLECAGLLKLVDDPVLAIILRRRMTCCSALRRLEADLTAAASKHRPPPDAQPIGQVSRRIGGRPKPWSAIYGSMLAGQTPFWTEGSLHLDHLLVRREGLDRFLDVHFESGARSGDLFAKEMDTNDAAELLNVGPETVRLLRTRSMLTDEVRPRSRVSRRDEVEAFAREHVSATELARCACTSPVSINAYMKDAGLCEVVPSVWNRLSGYEALSVRLAERSAD